MISLELDYTSFFSEVYKAKHTLADVGHPCNWNIFFVNVMDCLD